LQQSVWVKTVYRSACHMFQLYISITTPINVYTTTGSWRNEE